MSVADPRATARFLGAFFDELVRWGVRDAVVSPGSRSTPLAMTAYELSRVSPDQLRVYVDVDERGAAFLALGMAKASGRPAVAICTSGTAVANYYPAIMEAEASRVPLVVLTGDRPPLLQGLGAPQTCDQLHAFGSHVRAFRQMPLPCDDEESLAFARQAAREACIAAGYEGALTKADAGHETGKSARGAFSARIAGACMGGPVHVNFPFDEPLKPDFSVGDAFTAGRASGVPLGAESAASVGVEAGDGERAGAGAPASASVAAPAPMAGHAPDDMRASASVPAAGTAASDNAALASRCNAAYASGIISRKDGLSPAAAAQLAGTFAAAGERILAFAGEGSCATDEEARVMIAWARAYGVPLLADPLSGLRRYDADVVIDNYDSMLLPGGIAPEGLPAPAVIVRFGRYPISKKATQFVHACSRAGATQIVVDGRETRDFNAATGVFVRCSPVAFARALLSACAAADADVSRETLRCAPGVQKGRGADTTAPRDGASGIRSEFARAWMHANVAAAQRIARVAAHPAAASDGFEGAYVRRMLELAPAGSCVFAANSMSVRALDTFYTKGGQALTILCNRGLNGIDGTVSTAIGASRLFARTTLVTGDLTMLHDMNALALQRELRLHRERHADYPDERGDRLAPAPAAPARVALPDLRARQGFGLTIVLLNNNGGGIFDMLPQKSADPYFERLFLTPQDVDFEKAAATFGVPYHRAESVAAFEAAYRETLQVPDISLIEVPVPLEGVRERYGEYW